MEVVSTVGLKDMLVTLPSPRPWGNLPVAISASAIPDFDIWVLYAELRNMFAETRILRLLVFEQIQAIMLKKLPPANAFDHRKLAFDYLESILPSLLVENKLTQQTKANLPALPTTDRALRMLPLPINKRLSCFCDSVLVMMFVATTAYDVLTDLTFPNMIWQNKVVYQPQWLKQLVTSESTVCKDDQDIRDLMQYFEKFVRQVRKQIVMTNLSQAKTNIATIASEIRTILSKKCRETDPFKGEADAAEFYEVIIDSFGLKKLFSPIMRQHVRQSIPLVNAPFMDTIEINEPSPMNLIFPTRTKSITFQELVDYNFQDKFVESEKRGLGDDEFRFLSNISTISEIELFKLLQEPDPVTVYRKTIPIRLPDVFVVHINRGGGANTDKVTFPTTDVVFPLVEFGNTQTVLYRISAAIIHPPGHYYLYFSIRSSENTYSWYKYDDLARNIEKKDRKLAYDSEVAPHVRLVLCTKV